MPLLDLRDLRDTFRTHLLGVGGLPSIKYQNRNFDLGSVTNDPPHYIQEVSGVSDEEQSSTSFVESVGIYQLNVRVATGDGTETGEDLAKTLADRFAPAQALQSGTTQQCFSLYKTVRPTPFVDPDDSDWVVFPVQVLWRAFTVNNI